MPPARPRARRSRYRYTRRLGRSVPALLAVVFILGLLLGTSLAIVRTLNFLHKVVNLNNPVTLIQYAVDPPAGSIGYKLKYGQQVNLLVMGYGGQQNDAPWLTDTMMIVSIDPKSKRVMEASIPRDFYAQLDAWPDGRVYTEKINTAFSMTQDGSFPGPFKPQYTGKDGPGHLSEDTLTKLTGIHFDRYVAVDFVAFRDVVDALGGVTVHMDLALDDCHYPDYHNGYLNHGVPPGWDCPPGAGIHFAAGDYTVNGEQALEISRSREASQPEQATDFGRAKRQQMVVQAIKKKAASAGALTKVPQLMDALQANFRTDMDLNDINALYQWGANLPDSSTIRVALTASDLLDEYFERPGSCGPEFEYVLCPADPTYAYLHRYFLPKNTFIDPAVLAEKAPIQVINAIAGNEDVDDRVTNSLRPLGLNLAAPAPANAPPIRKSVIYDYSGGRYPATAQWLAAYFNAPVVTAVAASPGTPPVAASPIPINGEVPSGLVVHLGNDFYQTWIGQPQT